MNNDAGLTDPQPANSVTMIFILHVIRAKHRRIILAPNGIEESAMLLRTRRARSRSDGPRRPHWTRGRRSTTARSVLHDVSTVAASVLRVGGLARFGQPTGPALDAGAQRAHNRAQWDRYPCTRIHGAAFEEELASAHFPSD